MRFGKLKLNYGLRLDNVRSGRAVEQSPHGCCKTYTQYNINMDRTISYIQTYKIRINNIKREAT